MKDVLIIATMLCMFAVYVHLPKHSMRKALIEAKHVWMLFANVMQYIMKCSAKMKMYPAKLIASVFKLT